MLDPNTEYTKVEHPTKAMTYGLRWRTIFTRNRRIKGTLVSFEEQVATHGCWGSGYRRMFVGSIAAGSIESIFGSGRVRTREIIAMGPTMEEAVEIATTWLEKRKQTTAK